MSNTDFQLRTNVTTELNQLIKLRINLFTKKLYWVGSTNLQKTLGYSPTISFGLLLKWELLLHAESYHCYLSTRTLSILIFQEEVLNPILLDEGVEF